MCGCPWPQVPFEQAVLDATSGSPRVQRREYQTTGEIPVVDQGQEFIAGYSGREHAFRGQLPAVLFGDHTRAFKYVDFPFAIGADGVKVLVPRDGFEPRYVYYFFTSIHLPNAGYSRHFKFLREAMIPKPPLAEQRRIVDILSRAEGILQLRREAEKKAAELVPAIFLEMFGDPATNPKGWLKTSLSNVSSVISGVAKGRRIPAGDRMEVPYMRVANVKDGHLDLTEIKTIEIRPSELGKLRIEPGDLLMTEGGDPDKLGRAALWSGEIPDCAHQNHVFKVRTDRSRLVPTYLRALVGSHYGKDYFARVAKRTTGIASINKTQLSAFPALVPPLDLQRAFDRRVEAAESILNQQAEATKVAAASLSALLASAFARENK